jgi:hypothetical protein
MCEPERGFSASLEEGEEEDEEGVFELTEAQVEAVCEFFFFSAFCLFAGWRDWACLLGSRVVHGIYPVFLR